MLAGFLALTGVLLPADHFRTMVLVVDHMHQLGVMHRYALYCSSRCVSHDVILWTTRTMNVESFACHKHA